MTTESGVNCITGVYNLATQSDIAAGLSWYRDANTFADNLSDHYDVLRLKVHGVIAALSHEIVGRETCKTLKIWLRYILQAVLLTT